MLLVDYSHTMHRGIYAHKPDVVQSPTFSAHVILSMLLNVADKFGASKSNPLIIATDSKPYWREELYNLIAPKFGKYYIDEKLTTDEETVYKKYKGNRVKDPDFDWDAINDVNEHIIAALRAHSDFHVIQVAGAEADDIIGTLAKYAAREKKQCIIISSDKDFKQLQAPPFVNQYDPIKQEFVPEIDVERFMKIHCIAGDKGDNILAIRPRVAEKTAEKLLPQLDEILAGDPLARKLYKFNEKLIDLSNIPASIQEEIINIYLNEGHSNYNQMNLIKMFQKFGLARIAENVNKFKLTEEVKQTKLNSYGAHKEKVVKHNTDALAKFFEDED